MSQHDFTFGFEHASGANGSWGHLQVVSFKGVDAISDLYHYELTLVAKTPAPEVDTTKLLLQRCSLRLRTEADPSFRIIHGVVTEAQELYHTPDGMIYRVVMMPPLARALHRTRSRIFYEKTIVEIIRAVLQSDPHLTPLPAGEVVLPDHGDHSHFHSAHEHFVIRASESTSPRLHDPKARPYTVQYNESDFNFLARILEDEGIAFHYENGDAKSLLVLSDMDAGRTRIDPFSAVGPGLVGRDLEHIQMGGRARANKITREDYNWHNPPLNMETTVGRDTSKQHLFETKYPGGYGDPNLGIPLTTVAEQRYHNEANYVVGDGKTRVLFAGAVAPVQHNARPRNDGEYLFTKLTVTGSQHGVLQHPMPGQSTTPYTFKFEALRRGKDHHAHDSQFRPPLRAQRPRIVGSQTAFVTTDPSAPGAVVYVGDDVGCCRVRFHWDRDVARHEKEPTSKWLRVSQFNAGAGMGALWHPRVGDEVIVEHLEGDPDRPIITGRVYNAARLPPAAANGSPTVSTIKTFSIPGGRGFNEYLFDDKAGGEEIRQHAARDWNSVTEHSRSETIKSDSASKVFNNRTESTGVNRTATVGSNNSDTIGANSSTKIGANQTLTVGVNQTANIGGSQTLDVGGTQSYTVSGAQSFNTGPQSFTVNGSQTYSISASQSFTIGSNHSIQIGGRSTTHSGGAMAVTTDATQTMTAASSQTISAGANQSITAAATQQLGSTSMHVNAKSIMTVNTPTLQISAPSTDISTATTTMSGSAAISLGSPAISAIGALVTVNGTGTLNLNGGAVNINGAPVTVNGGASVTMTAGVIKLN